MSPVHHHRFTILTGLLLVLGSLALHAGDALPARPTTPAYLNLPPAPPVPTGTFTATAAYPNLTFQGAIAVRPVPGTNRLWVIEREGRIWSFEDDPATTTKTLVLDLNDDDVDANDGTPNSGHLTNSVRWWCQGWDDCGLMGLAFHPQFGQPGSANRGYFYVAYQAKSTIPDVGGDGANDYRPNSSSGANNTSNRIARFTINDASLSADPTSEQILINQPDRHLWHNGGDLFFGADGFLYGVNGDEGSAHDPWQNSQRITKGFFSGVLRIDVDSNNARSHAPPPRQAGQPVLYPGYGIPNDNPWVGIPGVLEEFYAIGLRSPHRMTYDAVTGHILVGDIGQGQREEIALVTRGSNHQWGYMEGFASKRVDNGMSNGRAPPPYATNALVAAGATVVPLTYTAPPADAGLPPGMLVSGDRVRFDNVLGQILSVSTWPYTSATLNGAPPQAIPAGTPMVRTTGLQTTRAITAADSTPDNGDVPSGLGTTTIPVSGIGVVPIGMCVSFGVADEYGSHQVIAVSDNGTSTTSITIRPRLTADLPSGTWIDRLTVIGSETAPVADFRHGGNVPFNAILGGYIYRGPTHPDLQGAYIFADNNRGSVYSLTGLGSMSPTITKLFDMPNYAAGPNGGYRGLSGFGLNHDSELLICRMQAVDGATNTSSGKLYKIIRTGGTVIGTPIPTDLAETGAFATDVGGNLVLPLQPGPALVPYGVNSPLWSDNAMKSRWIALPNPNGKTSGFAADEQATFTSSGAFSFPQGTVFVKHFELEDHAFPSHRRMLETRFLVRSPGTGVYGVTYKWNAAQTAATLLSDGLNETYTITHADNSTHVQIWSYPSRDDCLSCHNTGAGHVLGVNNRQLNGAFTYPGASDHSIYDYTGISDNQVKTWSHIGMFANPPADGAIPGLPKLVHVSDTAAPLSERVRSWLDANCSHCHRPGGVHAEFDARYDTPLVDQGLIDGPVNNALGIPFARVIAPKGISRSVLHLRDNSLTSGTKMPPLAKNLVDTAAISAIEQWITSMDIPLMVEITAPTQNTVMAINQAATITASSGFSENVTSVEFFVGGVSIGSDNSAPYVRSWTPTTAGTYVLTAVVHSASESAESAPITIKATVLPTVTLTAPLSGASDQAPGWFTLAATASDPDGSIAQVEFLRDGVVFSSDALAPYTTSLKNLAAGTYVLSARATDNIGGITTSASATVTVTGISGLLAEYWTNKTMTGNPALTRVEAVVDYDWNNGSPATDIPADNFSVRWSGTVTAPETGTYIFYTTSDDGAQLRVDNSLIIDKWVDQGPTTWTGTYALTAGQPVTIRMDYYESGGGASAKLEWSASGVGVPRAVIPQSALTPPPVAPTVTLTAPMTGTASAPATITWSANASDSDGVITQVELLRDGAVVASDASAPYGGSDGPLASGTYVYSVRATDSQGLTTTSSTATITVQKSPATVTLANLAQTYNGGTRPATATTNPPGLTVGLTYDGAGTAPTNVGSYTVVGTISDANYQGSASGTLVISKATATVTLASLTATYNGTAKSATATTTPAGLTVGFTYDGAATAPTNAGSYAVVGTISDANYQGSASGTLIINKATATVTLASLAQTYNGSTRLATATTNPAGLTIGFTYDAVATAPTNAGSYAVVGTISDTNYQGSASDILVISKATATVTLASLTATYDGTQKSATASTTPAALPVSFAYTGAPARTDAGTYPVTATVNHANYQGSATGSLVIGKATATVALQHLVQTIDGTPKPVTVVTTPTGLITTVTYAGSATAPSALGSYAVSASVVETNYIGSASGTLTITAEPVLTLGDQSVAEGDSGSSNAVLTAVLSITSTTTITVDWTASAGSATAGTDFTVVSGTLTFAPGDLSKPITIPVLGDHAFEGDETVIVTLSNAQQVQLDATSAVLTIVNDDANSAPVITEGTSLAITIDEDNTPIAFALTLHASDVDAGQTLAWSLTSAPTHGTLVALGNGGTQEIGYVPAAGFNGTDLFTVQVADGAGGSATCVITLTIAPRNDPPVNTALPQVTLAASGSLVVATATLGGWSDALDLVPGAITTTIAWQRADDAAGTNLATLAGTTTSHQVTAADVGKFLRVQVTASDDGEGLPATASTVAYSSFVAVTSPGGGGGSGSGSGSGGGGGCGLGGGITSLLMIVLVLLRRQRLR